MTLRRYALALGLALLATPAAAQTREVPRWPAAAYGQAAPMDGVRPTGEEGVLRSWRAPVDVHVGPGVEADMAEATLADAEAVMDGLERMGVALPLPDGNRGGTPSFDLYTSLSRPDCLELTSGSMSFPCRGVIVPNDHTGRAVPDALSYAGPWDRATAYGLVEPYTSPMERRRRVAQVIAEACVYGAKADHPVGFVRAMGATLARLATGLPLDPEDVRAFQREPARAWWSDDARSASAQRGAAVVLDAMTARWDDGRGTFPRGLMEAPVQYTRLGSPRLWDEPDVMDVLKRVTRLEARGFWGALLQIASARSLVGTPADLSDDRLDASLAALPTRVVRWGDLPAWALTTGIAPTGSATMELTLGDAPPSGVVGVWLHASPYHRWMASVLRVASDGHVLGTIDSELITDGEWAARVDSLEDVRRLIVVAVSAGDEEMDPDGAPVRDGWVAMNVGVSRDSALGGQAAREGHEAGH